MSSLASFNGWSVFTQYLDWTATFNAVFTTVLQLSLFSKKDIVELLWKGVDLAVINLHILLKSVQLKTL